MGKFDFGKQKKSAVHEPVSRCNSSEAVKRQSISAVAGEQSGYNGIITSDGIKLSKEQSDCIHFLESSSENIFVTGKAGAGKSLVLRTFIETTKKRVAVVAPTGIAAINVSGQTIHSFFGLDTAVQDVTDAKQLQIKRTRLLVLKCLDALIIDEVSMVRADIMDMIDHKLRIAKDNHSIPFGGCQIIAFGDLYQLPPVVDRDDNAKRFLYERYTNLHFFYAPAVQQCPFKVIELQEVHRQNDEKFIAALNKVRLGDSSQPVLQHLNTRVYSDISGNDCVSLTATNDAARIINEEHLAVIPSKLYSYTAQIDGTFEPEYDPTDRTLSLKVGAQVMMLKNDSEHRWVNGTIGKVSALEEDYIRVKIKGIDYSIDREIWEKYSYQFDTCYSRPNLTSNSRAIMTLSRAVLSYLPR